MNNFQQAILSNKDVAWEIVKLFHPDILDEYPNKYKDRIIKTKDRLSISLKYDWVILELRTQSHIKVDIGIVFECHLYSGNKSLDLFEKQLKNNKFIAWRFILDSGYRSENNDRIAYSDRVNDILNKHKIPKPTAKQMSDYYHSD